VPVVRWFKGGGSTIDEARQYLPARPVLGGRSRLAAHSGSEYRDQVASSSWEAGRAWRGWQVRRRGFLSSSVHFCPSASLNGTRPKRLHPLGPSCIT